jgi:hypothetical protein
MHAARRIGVRTVGELTVFQGIQLNPGDMIVLHEELQPT